MLAADSGPKGLDGASYVACGPVLDCPRTPADTRAAESRSGVRTEPMPLLSQSVRRRLLDEAQQHVMQEFTKDPAMPWPLRSLISALIRIFWADFVFVYDQPDLQKAEDASEEVLDAERAVLGW